MGDLFGIFMFHWISCCFVVIVKYEKTHVFICFPNFPFVALEEYGVNLFTDLEEAEKRLEQIRQREKIKKYQEIMEKNKKKT